MALKAVVKVGGYLFPSRLNMKKIKEYANLFRRIKKNSHSLVIVTGGGREARKYIEAARALGGSEALCDIMGIMVSRLNARLLIAGLGEDAYPEPTISIEDLRKAFATGKIVVIGGLQPGQSTNAVGILAAEAVEADLYVNATDVDGVHTADPKIDPKARKLEVVEADDLLKMVLESGLWAGDYKLFDPVAVKIVKRSRIKTLIVDGKDPKNIERAINGEKIGTLVKP